MSHPLTHIIHRGAFKTGSNRYAKASTCVQSSQNNKRNGRAITFGSRALAAWRQATENVTPKFFFLRKSELRIKAIPISLNFICECRSDCCAFPGTECGASVNPQRRAATFPTAIARGKDSNPSLRTVLCRRPFCLSDAKARGADHLYHSGRIVTKDHTNHLEYRLVRGPRRSRVRSA